MARMVKCIKLGRDAEGLDFPPYPGELGKRIYENVSKEAWQAWIKHQTMLINENKLNLADPRARKYLAEQMEEHFVGSGFEAMLLHLLCEIFPRARVGEVQLVLVDEHGLVLDPGLPGFLGDVLIDALAEFARVGGEVQPFRVAAELDAFHHPCHFRNLDSAIRSILSPLY